jgi:hypothetical protein
MAPVHWRHLWTGANSGYYTFWWPAIRHDSFVVVTAAEGRTSDLVPDRFVGAAWIEVYSVAPFDGGVAFVLLWAAAYPNLDVWTDITIFDPSDASGTN